MASHSTTKILSESSLYPLKIHIKTVVFNHGTPRQSASRQLPGSTCTVLLDVY